MLSVVSPGLLSSVQDQGRPDWQRYGISAGGVMDREAALWANRLVGNADTAAVLEMTLAGPTLHIGQGRWLALAGASADAVLDGHEVPVGSLVWAPAGSQLRLGAVRKGCRSYLAVSGGFDVPELMGSRSTALRADFGGLDGRALKAGDSLALLPSCLPEPLVVGRRWISPWRLRPAVYSDNAPTRLRLIAADELPGNCIDELLAQDFRVSPQSDRMGLRLNGEAIKRPGQDARLSAGLAFGSVQLPPDGQPIILGADRQSTGGYPLLGTVASIDHSYIAQLCPGAVLTFAMMTLAEAHAALHRQQLCAGRAQVALRQALKMATGQV
jgi:antagonist of KipI